MKKIIEAAEQVCELRLKYNSDTLSRNLCDAIAERKRLEQTPITEEWLKEHGFVDEPHERMLIYRKGDFGIECNLSSWEWYWANGDVLLNSLADLYAACELCGIELD